DGAAARGVDERIELVEEGVAHMDDVALTEPHDAVAVGVGARSVGHYELVAVQVEADVARERHYRKRDLRLGLGLHSEELDETFGRKALSHVLMRDGDRAGRAVG